MAFHDRLRLSPLIALLAALTGCANPYAQFFNPAPSAVPATNVDTVAAAAPSIYNYSADPKNDNQAMIENGYAYAGTSSFNTGQRVSKAQLLDQAKKVGAAAILVKSQYTNSVSGTVPFSVYHPGEMVTSNTNGSFNAYNNSGGSAYGNYNGTTTTQLPGQTTTPYIPYTVNRFDYVATYWVKIKKFRLGVYPADLPQDVRRKLQRNTGVVVNAVVRGTPAFSANLLQGDVILGCNGTDVIDAPSFLKDCLGASSAVTLDILRGDDHKTISVTLNPP